MRNHLIALIALLGLAGCYSPKLLQYDRPDVRRVLNHVQAGEALSGEMADGRTLNLENAVTTGDLICSAALTPACFPAARIVRLETQEMPGAPAWVYVAAAPLAPLALADMAIDGLDRALTGGPQTFTSPWAADALPAYNPCIRHVRREPNGVWPSDQKIRADLFRRRADLGGACLARLGMEYAFPVTVRRQLYLTGVVRQRFEVLACARGRSEAEGTAKAKAFVPLGGWHTEGREVDWPHELAAVLQDPATWTVTTDLSDDCADAGGVASDLGLAVVRTREGWPLPAESGFSPLPTPWTGPDG